MNQEEEKRLIDSYVASSKFVLDKDNVLRRADESSWATDTLFAVSISEPSLALKLCTMIAEAEGSEEMLERVANGPLLEILKRADGSGLGEIAGIALRVPALRELLSCVWEEHELPESTWDVIREHSAQ